MSNLSDFIGGVWRKLDIWRNANQNGLPMVQQAAFKYDPSYTIGTPVRLYNSVLGLWQALATGSGTDVFSSPDGKTWTLRTLPTSQVWRGVCSNNAGLQVAFGGSSTTAAAYSVNGTTWLASTLPSPIDGGECAALGALIVGVTNGTASTTFRTTNGTSWTAGTCGGTVSRIKALNDRLFAGNAGLASFYSTDGIAWNNCTGVSGVLASMAYGGGIYGGVKTGSTNIAYYSTNGIAFSTVLLPVTDTWADIQFDTPSGLFVLTASSATGVILTSPDLITWTQRKNFDLTTGAAAALQGPTGLAVQQGGVLRMPDRAAVEVTALI